MHSEKFKEFLREGNLKGLSSIPKSDLHNHLANGGNPEHVKSELLEFYKLSGKHLEFSKLPNVFENIPHMVSWRHKNFREYLHSAKNTWRYSFMQASNDGVNILSGSVFSDKREEFGSYEKLIFALKYANTFFGSNVTFLPELSFYAKNDNEYIAKEYAAIDEMLSHDYFTSIDLCLWGTESADFDFKSYSKIFRKAKDNGLLLKAHVGEYGTVDDVMRAVEELELDEVHHGNAAASSPQVMNWLAKNNIQFNICPTSNIMLGRVSSYKEHPIRKLFDAGVPVTINTDDMLIFGQSVSQEYLNLYSCGLMNEEELDRIRLTGLRQIDKLVKKPKIGKEMEKEVRKLWDEKITRGEMGRPPELNQVTEKYIYPGEPWR